MKLFIIADIHGERRYIDAAADMISAADLVVICGDLGKGGDRKSAEEMLTGIERYTGNIVGVHGNWDMSDVCSLLEGRGYSLHGRGRIIGGIGFFGVGGSSQTPMNTASEYTEDEIGQFLAAGFRQIGGASAAVLVSHAPPHRVRDRTFLGIRGGSRAIRTFIEQNRVDLCLAGHIHEAYGVERFNDCLVANSGSFKKGRYSLIDMGSPITVDQGRL